MSKSKKISGEEFEILNILQKNSKASLREMSRITGLSPSTVFDKIKKLEKNKVIKKYTVKLNLEKLGFSVKAFILIKFDPYSKTGQREVLKQLAQMYETLEAHIVSGEYDFLLKVFAKNTRLLGELITNKIRKTPGVLETLTLTVFLTEKE